jgi:hypothetical protein
LDELRALVEATKPVLVCITETWFGPVIDNELIQIRDYFSFRCDRNANSSHKRRGGGVAVYASRHSCPFLVDIPLEMKSPIGIECIVIGFSDMDLSFLLCAYVPPNLSSDTFSEIQNYITDIFDHLLQSFPNAQIFLCGDFNQYDFSFVLQNFDLVNVVQFPTFGNNILDKFFCETSLSNIFSAFSAPPLGSATFSHKIVFISKDKRFCEYDDACHKVYDLRKSNVLAFCEKLECVDWSAIKCSCSVDECVDIFYEHFNQAMSVIPVSFVKMSSKTKPWITPVLIELINKRWLAYRNKNFVLYNHYKVKVKQEIIKSKRIWSKRMCNTVKGVWSVVREIRNKNGCNSVSQLVSLFSDVLNAVESLNDIFSSHYGDSPSCLSNNLFVNLNLHEIPTICDDVSVLKMLNDLRTDKASGSDNIPPVLLKAAARHICGPLSHIFNLSFANAYVPRV